ncbi:hypothetical protein [Tsukamurella strandjordii]|uniref:Uncharacterized protein n=1 Tax=Tsukamurella strandjordii TaxID=147577 RepID=A0AA90N7P5_9ACTN|nr:hypothetical protein [Tsukamurella strandjordii]MDP0397142.1 hypothetical protein [Tsukamurella strandjordii]
MNPEQYGDAPSDASDPAAVRTAVEDLMHRVDALEDAPVEDLGTVAGVGELATLGRQAALFEQAHQLLVDALDSVERA